jgi:hypothetical protein
MAYVFEEKEFRIAVRTLLKNKLNEEHVVSIGDKTLLPSEAQSSDLPEKETLSSGPTSSQETVSATNTGRDINAERRLRVDAQGAALDFESTMVDVLGLEDVKSLPDDLQETYAKIMDEMSLGIQNSVQNAISRLKSFPRKQEK